MSVLVAGGAGYIGSVTAKVLLESGRDVVVYDNLSRGHRQAVPAGAKFVQGELADTDRLRRALREHRVTCVMHFAAHSLVPESMEKPELYFDNNVATGLRVLEAMRAEGTPHIVFSSTCATYGSPRTLPIREDDPQTPESVYGESKLMFERMLAWYHRIHGLRVTILRYFNACGAYAGLGEDHQPETHLIPLVLQVPLGQRERVSIFGADYPTRDGTAIRDYIHIRDLARAHIAALSAPVGTGFDHYNLGNGSGYSVREVIDAARRVTGREIPAVEAPRRPGDPPELVSTTEKIARELGFACEIPSIEDIIASAWEWHRDHPRGYA
ncbi:MAG: UDP-glucose 4-epimerase GalE [Deltaproteobacteria bacterium]|nr:UDP-glucose 4-epimerase GalE [Deltaproteobacteria bacterium]